MIGKTFKRKDDGTTWRVAAAGDGEYVLTPHPEFGPNVAYSAAQLRREFTRTGEVPEPEPTGYDAETEGWKRLSAEQRFTAIAAAAAAGEIQPGDTLTLPGFHGEPVDATEPLTKEEVGRLRAAARKLRGPSHPTPEETFAADQRDAIRAAADRITSNASALAAYEVGQLQASPQVEKVVDAYIRERNRREDRQAYPNSHVFDRGQR